MFDFLTLLAAAARSDLAPYSARWVASLTEAAIFPGRISTGLVIFAISTPGAC